MFFNTRRVLLMRASELALFHRDVPTYLYTRDKGTPSHLNDDDDDDVQWHNRR